MEQGPRARRTERRALGRIPIWVALPVADAHAGDLATFVPALAAVLGRARRAAGARRRRSVVVEGHVADVVAAGLPGARSARPPWRLSAQPGRRRHPSSRSHADAPGMPHAQQRQACQRRPLRRAPVSHASCGRPPGSRTSGVSRRRDDRAERRLIPLAGQEVDRRPSWPSPRGCRRSSHTCRRNGRARRPPWRSSSRYTGPASTGSTTFSSTATGTGGGPGCAPATTSCKNGCTDLESDPDNCGACGTVCAPGEVCSVGQCAVTCLGGSCSGTAASPRPSATPTSPTRR